MATFSIPVTIGVDEEAIAREIEKDVKNQVIRNIGDKVESIIYKENYSYYRSEKTKDDTPLRNMVERAVKDVIDEKTDLIVNIAAEKLADKLSRQKAVKAVGVEVAQSVLEE